MAEQVSIGYKRLFEVRALHHYHLYKDLTDFLGLSAADHKKRLVSGYDVRPFLSFTPTPSTQRRLNGLGCVFKKTALGFIVAAADKPDLFTDVVFEFAVTVQQADFVYYTTLSGRRQKIREISFGDDIYRYKENVFLFANGTGTKRTIKGEDWFCLSTEIPLFDAGAIYPADALTLINTDDVQQYVESTIGATPVWATIHTVKGELPAYVHQDDAPSLSPPAGSSFPGIELSDELPENIYALIRIESLPYTHEFSLLKSATQLRSPVFEIHFKSRL